MNRFNPVILSAFIFAAFVNASEKVSFSFSMGGDTFSGELAFHDDYVVEFEGDVGSRPAVIYDLKHERWKNIEGGYTLDLEQAMSWMAASDERTRESMKKLEDPAMKEFVASLMDPQFIIKENGSTIVFSNDHFGYEIEGLRMGPAALDRFYAYDKMNALNKAMTQRKMPPNAQLAVSRELMTRRLFPSKISVEIRTPGGSTSTTANYSMKPLTDEEIEDVEEIIRTNRF